MSRHNGQTSSKLDTNSEKLQLAVRTQQHKLLVHKIFSFKIAQYQHQDEMNLLLNTSKRPPRRNELTGKHIKTT